MCILMTQWSFVIVHVWNDANPNLFKVLQNQDHEWCQESTFVKYNRVNPNMNILMDMMAFVVTQFGISPILNNWYHSYMFLAYSGC